MAHRPPPSPQTPRQRCKPALPAAANCSSPMLVLSRSAPILPSMRSELKDPSQIDPRGYASRALLRKASHTRSCRHGEGGAMVMATPPPTPPPPPARHPLRLLYATPLGTENVQQQQPSPYSRRLRTGENAVPAAHQPTIASDKSRSRRLAYANASAAAPPPLAPEPAPQLTAPPSDGAAGMPEEAPAVLDRACTTYSTSIAQSAEAECSPSHSLPGPDAATDVVTVERADFRALVLALRQLREQRAVPYRDDSNQPVDGVAPACPSLLWRQTDISPAYDSFAFASGRSEFHAPLARHADTSLQGSAAGGARLGPPSSASG